MSGRRAAVFISDVHANIEALDGVLEAVGRDGRGDHEGEGDIPIYCLGDMVGYGASPNEVLDRLRERRATCILGNHDVAVLTGSVSQFNPTAAVAAMWASRKVSDENRKFLSSLPQDRTIGLGPRTRLYMTHGSPDDKLWEYVRPTTHQDLFGYYLRKLSVDAIALGHTHVPFVWSEGRGLVFNPGSVGQPRNGDSRASYAVVVLSDGGEAGGISVEQKSTPYDIESAARKILEAGLPGSLSTRLRSGV